MYTHKKPKSELGFTKSTIFYIELIKDTILLNGWNNDFFCLNGYSAQIMIAVSIYSSN